MQGTVVKKYELHFCNLFVVHAFELFSMHFYSYHA